MHHAAPCAPDTACPWARWAACAGTAAVTAAWTSTVQRPAAAPRAPCPNEKEFTLNNSTAKNLLQHVEPMAALSITHLTASTRQKLAADDLSVNAYPTESGGFV